MLTQHYDELASLDLSYWWFKVRHHYAWRTIRRVAGPQPDFLLDVGCGTAGFLAGLLRNRRLTPEHVLGVDASEHAVTVGRQRGVPMQAGDVSDVHALRLPRAPDVITLLDVLEHLPEPVTALRDLRRLSRPGGHIVILVPALQRLWSRWDDLLGHRKRYDRPTMRRELADAGWRLLSTRYLFAPLVVPALLRERLIRRGSLANTEFQRVPRLIDRLLTGVFIAETYLPAPPFGTTLAGVAVNDG